jgi:Leucine-rich repeat (LRR) protein
MKNRFISILTALSLLLAAGCGNKTPIIPDGPDETTAEEIEIDIPDPDPIFIKGVEITWRQVRVDLSGLELACEDLKPLSEMINLQRVILDDNNISDLSPLKSLTNLTVLSAMNNQISDLSPIAGLTKLKFLDFDNNQISDLTPLSELVNVERLFLKNNLIEDVSPLASMTALFWLDVKDNMITHRLIKNSGGTRIRYADYSGNKLTN